MLDRLYREKQLLCMARAILKRSKVLVMDEVRDVIVRCGVVWMVLTSSPQATASVDYATDELIGKTIRQLVTSFDFASGNIHRNPTASSLKVQS